MFNCYFRNSKELTAMLCVLAVIIVASSDANAQCGPGNGGCCVANGTPGCSNSHCCNLICADDPFCCNNTWDGICAEAANKQCGICGAGCPGSGDCCEANGTPGCDDADCCAAVCAEDPFCCDTGWDSICADEADDLCGCSVCPGTGDCCEANGTPGCNDADCCTAVCAEDPFCCNSQWDSLCADEASELCDICAQPDLIVNAIWTVPDPPLAGEPFTVHAELCNFGNAGTGFVSIPLEYYFEGEYVESDVLSLGLGEGDCDPEWTSNWIVNTPGKYEICVVIDPGNIIDESDETNNTLCVPVNIKPRPKKNPLLIKDETFVKPNEAEPGDEIKVFMAVHNPNPFPVELFLGTSIYSPSGDKINSPECDETVKIPANTDYQYQRCFNIPKTAKPGLYDVCYAIRNPETFEAYDLFCEQEELSIVMPPVCVPNAGDCFDANGTPGCEIAICCESVCADDPFCCNNSWDSLCATEAGNMCLDDLEFTGFLGFVYPNMAFPGLSVTINYEVYNPNDFPLTFGLGCSIQLGGIGPEISDQVNDINFTIDPNQTQTFARIFDIPDDVLAGPYKVFYGLWKVINGDWVKQYEVYSATGENGGLHIRQPTFGTTIITHGYTFAEGIFGMPDWPYLMGKAIVERAGNIGTVLGYDPSDGKWKTVDQLPQAPDLPPMPASLDPNEEIVLVFDWSVDSDGCNLGGTAGTAEGAADALYAALRDPSLPGSLSGKNLIGSGVHFIGHSRGTVVNSEVIQRLGREDPPIQVTHVSTLDPHPIPDSFIVKCGFQYFGDPQPQTWTNVDWWADNYWQNDDFPKGQEIDGAYNYPELGSILGWLNLPTCNEHCLVHEWYYGTIDLSYIPPQLATREDWYGADLGLSIGYNWSQVVGGGPGPDVTDSSTDPSVGEVSTLYNGNFQAGLSSIYPHLQFAGWRYHGGESDVPVLLDFLSQEGDNIFLRMGDFLYPQPNRLVQKHNRLWVAPNYSFLAFSMRIHNSSPDDRFQIILHPVSGGDSQMILDELIGANKTGWFTHLPVAIPESLRERTYTPEFKIVPVDGLEGTVDLDNIEFVQCAIEGDIDGNGAVDESDLVILLDSWGSCGDCNDCPADLDGNCTVNTRDLLDLFANWGPCP